MRELDFVMRARARMRPVLARIMKRSGLSDRAINAAFKKREAMDRATFKAKKPKDGSS
jgi:hypothetical protein